MVGSSKRGRFGATNAGSPATTGDERKRRKKLQNRLNQRAFRSRLPESENTRINTKKPQYPIDRWQLDEYEASNSPQASPAQDSPAQVFPVLSNKPGTIQRASGTTWFPLPADHLLHHVKYNVFRGLCQNKITLETLAVQYDTANHPNGPFSDHKIFPSYSVILPTAPHGSGSLTPTTLQMSAVHPTWINFIPSPKI